MRKIVVLVAFVFICVGILFLTIYHSFSEDYRQALDSRADQFAHQQLLGALNVFDNCQQFWNSSEQGSSSFRSFFEPFSDRIEVEDRFVTRLPLNVYYSADDWKLATYSNAITDRVGEASKYSHLLMIKVEKNENKSIQKCFIL